MRRGVAAGQWEQFSITSQNVASAKEIGRFILGLMLPILFVVMVAMGCFFPAVDATAGERERGTWETLMGTSANRMSIITAKYLYVATLGGIAGILNLTAMLITVKPLFAPLLAKAGESIVFSVPLPALPLLLLGAILMAGFVSAGMMIFAAFAKTFKEGQAMITPFYLVVLLPLMFLQVPGLKFTLSLALIPVVNVAMMVRSAISGEFPAGPIVVTLLISGLAIFLALRLGVYIIQFEEVLLGGRSGGLARFLKSRLSPQRASPADPRT
jgi:sodium transport system permease protein